MCGLLFRTMAFTFLGTNLEEDRKSFLSPSTLYERIN